MLAPLPFFFLSVLFQLIFFFPFFCRPSTKTIWFWRKETSTSIHNSLGRRILMHTSLTSTPMMIINLRLLCHIQDSSLMTVIFLCFVMRFLTPCVGLSHWDLMAAGLCWKPRHTMPPAGGNAYFLSGALGYIWKAQKEGAYPALSLDLGKLDLPNVDTHTKKNKKKQRKPDLCCRMLWEIPFNFPVILPKQTWISSGGKERTNGTAWLHLSCLLCCLFFWGFFVLFFCMTDHIPGFKWHFPVVLGKRTCFGNPRSKSLGVACWLLPITEQSQKQMNFHQLFCSQDVDICNLWSLIFFFCFFAFLCFLFFLFLL